MSRTTHTQRLAQLRWLQVLGEVKSKFKDVAGAYFMEQLKKVRFTKQGKIKRNKFGNMALDEFPSLIRMWEERQDES